MVAKRLSSIATMLLLMALATSCARTERAEPFAETENSSTLTSRETQDSSNEASSETDKRLQRVLAKYPRADANGDGVLTASEIRSYMAKQRKAGKRRRSAGMPAGLRKLYESRRYVSKDSRQLRYDIMKPKDYDPKKKYPVVLCLHGSGGSTQAARVLAKPRLRAKYPSFVLAPEALVGEAWGERPFGAMTDVQPLVLEIIRALQNEFSIDAKRLYVTGQSAGGFGTYAFIIRNPDKFAAAAPVCGAIDPANAGRIAKIPIWIFHGDQDQLVPVRNSRDMYEALRKAGGDPKYTEYKGVKHNSWDKAYATEEFWEWLFTQKRRE
jgi:predicted peptidase